MESFAPALSETTYQRCLEKIIPEPNSGCWLWFGATNKKGYGHIRANGVWWLIHRFMYTYHKGPIPKGEVIRHTCDNSSCANPDHLLAGSAMENVLDQIRRGRFKPRQGICKPVEFYIERNEEWRKLLSR